MPLSCFTNDAFFQCTGTERTTSYSPMFLYLISYGFSVYPLSNYLRVFSSVFPLVITFGVSTTFCNHSTPRKLKLLAMLKPVVGISSLNHVNTFKFYQFIMTGYSFSLELTPSIEEFIILRKIIL